MGTCHLFAGMHKTGSTALQQYLGAQRDLLGDAGVHLVQAGWSSAGHRDLARALAEPADRADAASVLEAELTAVAANAVIAAERFGDLLADPEVAQVLVDAVGAAGMRLHVVVVIRPQVSFFNSRYSQLVKQLRCALRFEEFVDTQLRLARHDYHRHYGWMVGDDRLDATFVPFDAVLRRRGICTRAAELMGLEGFVEHEPAPVNEILGTAAIEQLLALQRNRPELATMSRADRRAEAIAANAAAVASGANVDRFDGVTAALRARIETQFATSNEAFARLAWGRGWAETFDEA